MIVLNQPYKKKSTVYKFPKVYEADNVLIPIGMDIDEDEEWLVYYSFGACLNGQMKGGVMLCSDFEEHYETILCSN